MEEKSKLKENAVHGTVEFPMAVYDWEGERRYPVPLHWHGETEVIYLERGYFSLTVGMKKETREAPALIFIPAGEIHAILLEEGQLEKAVVFDLEMLSFEKYDGIQYHLLSPLLEQKVRFPLAVTPEEAVWPEAERLFLEIYQYGKQTNLSAHLHVKADLYILLALLSEHGMLEQMETVRREDAERIKVMKRVLTFLHSNFYRPLRIEEIASVAGMNPQYFCRYFKKVTGKTVMEYVNEVRIDHACQELMQTDDKIIEVAMRSGYDNIGYFIRRFQQSRQMTPSEYRKKCRRDRRDRC